MLDGKEAKRNNSSHGSEIGNRSIGPLDVFSKADIISRVLSCLIFTAGFFALAYFLVCAFGKSGVVPVYGIAALLAAVVSIVVLLLFSLTFYIRYSAALREALSEDEDILDNVVGGTMITFNDDLFTIIKLTDMFYTMLGYSPGEIKKRYHNEFSRLLVGEDSRLEFARQRRELQSGRMANARYKLLRGDGSAMWVSGRSYLTKNRRREPVVYTVLLDITGEMETQERLLLAEQRNRIVFETINSGVFDLDLISNKLQLSELILRDYNISRGSEIHLENIASIVDPEDYESILKTVSDIRSGERRRAGIIARLRSPGNNYEHYSVSLTAICDNNSVPVRAVGIMSNVEDRYKKELELRRKADRDSLSGLYNKGATQQLIENTLSSHPDERHAVILCDLDNFKSVNDTLGHAAGDEAIVTASGLLESVFGGNSIVGRVGGDEFMIMCRDLDPDPTDLIKMLDMVRTKVPEISVGGREMQLTFSIGVTMYPKDASDFKTLYKKADIALYKAKKKGKNRFEFYEA